MVECNPAFLRRQAALVIACRNGLGFNERTQLYPGIKLFPNPSDAAYLIAGRFGILRTLPDSPVLVGHLGFDFVDSSVVITNSPQGRAKSSLDEYPEPIRQAVFAELRNGFREDLLKALLRIGKGFKEVGVECVRGVSAAHDPRVDLNGGSLPYGQALKSMDYLYERFGFRQDVYGNYVLSI